MNQPYLIPNYYQNIDIIRAPYTWEDGYTLRSKIPIQKSINLNSPGIKILNFHPIDIYLNTCTFQQRNKFKGAFKSVIKADKKSCQEHINYKKYGMRDFLINIIKIIKIKKIKTTNLHELNIQFRKNLKK